MGHKVLNTNSNMSDGAFDPFVDDEFVAAASTENNDSFGSSGVFSHSHSHDSAGTTSPTSRSRTRSVSRSPSGSRHARSRSKSRSPGGNSGRTPKPSRKGKRPSKGSNKSGGGGGGSSRSRHHRRSSNDAHDIPRTPASAAKTRLASLTSPVGSESSSGSFACATPRLKISETTRHSKLAQTALSVWDMRSRFLTEFPNDSLPSDEVLKILYSPEKMIQLQRVERFQQEHPGEPVPSDDVLRRLYDVPSTTPRATVQEKPRNNLLTRQDSGLTFATESQWQQKMESKKKGLFSDFGLDDFGKQLEEPQEPQDDLSAEKLHRSTGDLALSRSCHSRSNHARKRNPSLEILKIGTVTVNKKSASQSLGSYTENKTVTSDSKTLSQSVHGRKTIHSDLHFRKPTFQGNNPSASKPPTSDFDPFQEEEEDNLHDSEYDSAPSKPSSFIDLLEIPSEHHPKDTVNTKRESGHGSDPFSKAANASFGSVDSSGRRRKGGNSRNRKSIHKEKKKTKKEASTRKSRSIDGNDGASKRAARTVGRTKSDTFSDMKGSTHGKRKSKAINRTKSASEVAMTFDFETPSSFGFNGPNVFKKTIEDVRMKSANSSPAATNSDACPLEDTRDFFDVAVVAWEGNKANNVSTPTKLAPSRKEKRPPKVMENDAAAALEDEDFFPDAPPLTIGSGIKGSTRMNSGGGAVANNAADSGKTQSAAVTAMGGWMQEMPGFTATIQTPPPPPPEESDESDDSSGFELQLPGGGGDISPLTAYTRKPVALVRRR